MSVNAMQNKINVEFTYDDIVDEIGPEREHLELFSGELVVSSRPIIKHQIVAGNISAIIHNYLKNNPKGRVLAFPVGIYLDAKTFFEPDILFISHENEDRIKKNYIEGAPDLVVEIISPESAKRDRGYKFKRYAREGVREYFSTAFLRGVALFRLDCPRPHRGRVGVQPLGFGHPGGATGVKQAAEIFRQMKGLCGDYQLQRDLQTGLTVNMGGDDRTTVALVLENRG